MLDELQSMTHSIFSPELSQKLVSRGCRSNERGTGRIFHFFSEIAMTPGDQKYTWKGGNSLKESLAENTAP